MKYWLKHTGVSATREIRNGPKTAEKEIRIGPKTAEKRMPKKSAYYGYTQASANKKKLTEKQDSNNSSNGTSVTKGDGHPTKGHSFKQNATEKQAPTTNPDSIFITPPRNFTQLASDVVRADCMNHGYKIEKTVGEGAYAKVKLAEVLPFKLARNPEMAEDVDGEGTLKVAIKVIDGKNVPREFLKKFLPRELSNHVPLPPNKHVVRVYEQFKANDRVYVVMEYCSRGDLLDVINQSISESKKGLGEEKARILFRMMAEGIHHIHTNGIVHRDLKCENILLDHEDNIKITDFGFSTKFIPGHSDPLKTSCGSYAYTAPEVIKVKPYDGTKSDVWSMGIILFAMLNGRLPFNDAQLTELEEDMKMQRLRFERTVSFESMVLVRRILQFNPSSRPCTADILADTWLTGKRGGIPRQNGKTKWPNHPSSKAKLDDVQTPYGDADPLRNVVNPMYYKMTLPERGNDATVTVNHQRNETVVLKSRAGPKKNIWIRGPPVSQRPNTWPRCDRSKTTASPNRGSQTRGKSKPATIVVKQEETKKKSGKPDTSTRVSINNIQLSKWFMEKYTAGKEASIKGENSKKACACCKVEDDVKKEKTRLNVKADDKGQDLRFLDTDDSKSVSKKVGDQTKAPSDKKIEEMAKSVSPDVCGRFSTPPTRQHPVSSASRTKSAVRGPPSPDPSKKVGFVKHMANQPTSHYERVKYFRARLMMNDSDTKHDEQNIGTNGLPPLMVQALKAERPVETVTSKPPPSPTRTQSPPQRGCYKRRPSATTWKNIRAKSGVTSNRVKPVQRVVVHSAVV